MKVAEASVPASFRLEGNMIPRQVKSMFDEPLE
jgi:hypothetical protein